MPKLLHASILKHILQNATCFGLIKFCIRKSLSGEVKTLQSLSCGFIKFLVEVKTFCYIIIV